PRACWIPAANTGVLKTVSTTFATSPLMKIARASAVAQAPRSWPPFAISPYRFSASPELATSPQHFAAVLVRAIPSSFASSGCDFDVAVLPDLDQSKAAVIGSLRSPESQRGYRHAIDEFIEGYCLEPRLSFKRTFL